MKNILEFSDVPPRSRVSKGYKHDSLKLCDENFLPFPTNLVSVTTVDQFLDDQTRGRIVDTQNPFTIDRKRSNIKTLDSIPQTSLETLCRLLDSAIWQLGLPLEQVLIYMSLTISFIHPRAEIAFVKQLFEELKYPFGAPSPAANIARAVYLGTALGGTAIIKWRSGDKLQLERTLELKSGRLEIPENLGEPTSQGLRDSIRLIGYRF